METTLRQSKYVRKLASTKGMGVTIHWTGLLDWTTGLKQNGIKCLLQLFSV